MGLYSTIPCGTCDVSCPPCLRWEWGWLSPFHWEENEAQKGAWLPATQQDLGKAKTRTLFLCVCHGFHLSFFFFHMLAQNLIFLLVKNLFYTTCFITTSQKLSLQPGPEWKLIFCHSLWHQRELRLSSWGFLPGVWGWKVIPCSSFGELSTSLSPMINQALTTGCLPCG